MGVQILHNRIIPNEKGWVDAPAKFVSHAKIVNSQGKSINVKDHTQQYELLAIQQHHLTVAERAGRGLLGLLIAVLSLGLACLAKNVRNYFTKEALSKRYICPLTLPKTNEEQPSSKKEQVTIPQPKQPKDLQAKNEQDKPSDPATSQTSRLQAPLDEKLLVADYPAIISIDPKDSPFISTFPDLPKSLSGQLDPIETFPFALVDTPAIATIDPKNSPFISAFPDLQEPLFDPKVLAGKSDQITLINKEHEVVVDESSVDVTEADAEEEGATSAKQPSKANFVGAVARKVANIAKPIGLATKTIAKVAGDENLKEVGGILGHAGHAFGGVGALINLTQSTTDNGTPEKGPKTWTETLTDKAKSTVTIAKAAAHFTGIQELQAGADLLDAAQGVTTIATSNAPEGTHTPFSTRVGQIAKVTGALFGAASYFTGLPELQLAGYGLRGVGALAPIVPKAVEKTSNFVKSYIYPKNPDETTSSVESEVDSSEESDEIAYAEDPAFSEAYNPYDLESIVF